MEDGGQWAFLSCREECRPLAGRGRKSIVAVEIEPVEAQPVSVQIRHDERTPREDRFRIEENCYGIMNRRAWHRPTHRDIIHSVLPATRARVHRVDAIRPVPVRCGSGRGARAHSSRLELAANWLEKRSRRQPARHCLVKG